jgi:energy-coupling factor transporter ATP-binding protein EcfA2
VSAPRALPVADLAHPCLWPAAAVLARWRGAETLHAGALVDARGGAWAVLGDRGAGKSTLLAAVALAGHPVLADDLLVVEGRECFAGPRCIDLRRASAEHLGITSDTSSVRSTQRRRLGLEPSEGRLALRGFVYLHWGDTLAVEQMVPGEHLGVLSRQRRVLGLGADVDHLLDLAGLPALRLVRPRAWEVLEASCGALIDAVGGQAR